ncbi:MAG: hypothetical protein AAGI37_10600 [Planctomycetota bacterium]
MAGEASKQHQQRFSLTSIVIIGTLVVAAIAIIIPALGSARVNPRWVQDINQLRGIVIALELYMEEHNGYFPPNVQLLSEHHYCSDDQFISNADPVQTMRSYIGEEPPAEIYQHGSYIFFPTNGIGINSIEEPSRFIVAYSPFTRKSDEKHPVVFLGGQTDLLSYSEVWDLITHQLATIGRSVRNNSE